MLSTTLWSFLSHSTVVATLGIAILAILHYDKSRPRYLLYFGLSYLAYSLAVAWQVVSLPSSPTLSSMIGGILFVATAVLLAQGLVTLAGRSYSYWLPATAVVAIVVCRLYHAAVDDGAMTQFFLTHITVVVILLHGAYHARPLLGGSSAEKVLYASFLLLTLSTIPRSFLALPASGEPFGGDLDAYWMATQISIYVFSIVIGFALINTLMQRRIVVHRALSETDALTGLLNRRGFYNAVGRRVSRVKTYTVLLADIDHFKSVNDTYGHRTGDVVLSQSADIIDSSIRPEDVSGRIGGEEFAIFLPDTTLQEGHNIAERLRRNFENFQFERGNLRCTISLGVAHCDKTVPIADAIFNADTQLYQAKDNGRNLVRSILSYS